MPEYSLGIIVLVAGGSLRMGSPKQLLKIRGVPLIRLSVETAIKSGCQPVVVVVGAYAKAIEPELSGLDIHVAFNQDWETGMSGSIVLGLKKLVELAPDTSAAILMVGDQPSLTSVSLQKLITNSREHPSKIIAARYSAQIGTPALFPRDYFEELFELKGKGGAKSLLQRHHETVTVIDLPEAAADLDTPEQFESWTGSQSCAQL